MKIIITLVATLALVAGCGKDMGTTLKELNQEVRDKTVESLGATQKMLCYTQVGDRDKMLTTVEYTVGDSTEATLTVSDSNVKAPQVTISPGTVVTAMDYYEIEIRIDENTAAKGTTASGVTYEGNGLTASCKKE